MTQARRGQPGRGRAPGMDGSMARGLGWLSIGIGLVELLAPRMLARALGMRGSEPLLRAYGMREIGTGAGILTARNPAPWIWGRVGGDALDLIALADGLDRRNPRKGNAGVALAAVGGIALLDLLCARSLSTAAQPRPPMRDYSNRRGMPRPPEAMRGAARDFETPADMRVPEALRPFASG